MTAPPAAPDEIAYFDGIETRFAQLRGTPLLLSPKDWALVASWHRQGIPLRIVLGSLDAVFHARKEASDGTGARSVVSLGYCRHAVEEAFAEWKESQLGAHDAPSNAESALGPEEAAGCLHSWAAEMDQAAERVKPDATVVFETSKALRELAAELIRTGAPPLVSLEERLEEFEDRLLDRLLESAGEDLREKMETHVSGTLSPLRDRLTARAYESTRRSHLRAQVREAYGLPRLTLYQIG